jgi:hypothetical protein
MQVFRTFTSVNISNIFVFHLKLKRVIIGDNGDIEIQTWMIQTWIWLKHFVIHT